MDVGLTCGADARDVWVPPRFYPLDGADTLPGLAQAIARNNSDLAQSEIAAIQACLEESIELMMDGVLPPNRHRTGTGPDDAVGNTVIVLLSLGLPALLVGTVYLSKLFSAPPEASEALLSRSRAQSPVHVETDDGTSTEV